MAKDKNVYITMIGSRRVGKSSVLSAMLNSLGKFQNETGVALTPIGSTKQKMDEKLTELNKLFQLHQKGEEFETQSGYVGGTSIAAPTDAITSYDFQLSVQEQKGSICNICFTDIRGEDIVQDAAVVQSKMQVSSVILIAIDSVALMEKDGSGKSWHNSVNYPTQIAKLLRDTYANNDNPTPQLILFVPLKCEKYYWQDGGMEQLNARIKEEYEGLLTFLENFDCFSVAITPILTLGDVVFSRFDGNDPNNGVYKPLYKIRDVAEPKFDPKFCEQPLYYLIKYILSLPGFAKKKQNKFWAFMKFGIAAYFGLIGIAIYLLTSKIGGKKLDLKKLSNNIKLTGDGYELLIDKLGIAKKMK